MFAVRLTAIAFQVATILLAYRAGRDVFPSRSEVALGAAAFVAFLPTQVQLSGAINNDGLTTLWCVALFWRMALLVQGRGTDVRGAVVAGLVLGGGLWTKLTIIQLIPTLFIAAFLATRTGNLTLTNAARWLALVLGVGILAASPLFIRNTLLYGDPLNLKIFPLTAGPDPATPTKMMAMLGWGLAYLLAHQCRSLVCNFLCYFAAESLATATGAAGTGHTISTRRTGWGIATGSAGRCEGGGEARGLSVADRTTNYRAVFRAL